MASTTTDDTVNATNVAAAGPERAQNPTPHPDDPGASEIEVLSAQLHSLIDRIAATDITACSNEALVEVAASIERAINRLTFQGDQQIVECSDRSIPLSLGFQTVAQFMNARLRVSEPARRKRHMEATTAFRQLTGESGEAEHPTLAKAFARGAVGSGHIRVVLDYLRKIPVGIPHDQRVAAESTLSELACEHTPDQIAVLGARLLAHLDPDGDLVDHNDRQRQRRLYLGRQDAQKMSKLTAYLTPTARARLEVFLEVWGQEGMNNPEDPMAPSGAYSDADAQTVEAAAARDSRTMAQRNHDALEALMTNVLESGTLAKSHRGLPVQLVIKADLNSLRTETGVGVTASGTLLPIHDVIELAAHSDAWIAMFQGHSELPLYLGKARLASRGQRIASFARVGGEMCSAPDCDQSATRVEMHHANLDYALGGLTDINNLAPACPKHNRWVGPGVGKYTTGIHHDGPDAGRCWWRLNANPGAPPNPERVNALPSIREAFDGRLDAARARIHPTASNPAPAAESRTSDPSRGSDRGSNNDTSATALTDLALRDIVRIQESMARKWDAALSALPAELTSLPPGLTVVRFSKPISLLPPSAGVTSDGLASDGVPSGDDPQP